MLSRVALCVTLFALAGLTGCIAPIPHSPNTSLVRELGEAEAEERLRQLMTRARSPRITDAEVQDDAVIYSATGLSPWWYTPHQGKAAILFSALARIDLYENARTFLYDSAGAELSVILHQNVNDAREFIDLILSFQASWQGGGSGEQPKEEPAETKEEPNETKTDLMEEDGGNSNAEEVEPEGDEVKKDLMEEDQ